MKRPMDNGLTDGCFLFYYSSLLLKEKQQPENKCEHTD
jgi:hypothetical protein